MLSTWVYYSKKSEYAALLSKYFFGIPSFLFLDQVSVECSRGEKGRQILTSRGGEHNA